MKRKTNLFYLDGPDSKFLTFSNYAEYLTGNFVSPDYKLFPSKFICLYIPQLENNGITDNDLKAQFIKNWLVGYYENKLAALRDYSINYKDSTYNTESQVSPLSYLLDTLDKYKNDENSGTEPSPIQITYIGDITEQNYNGTYTDSICIIDGNNYKYGEFIKNKESYIIDNNGVYVQDNDILYGWTNEELQDTSYDSSITYDSDDNNLYTLKSNMFGIKVCNIEGTDEECHVISNSNETIEQQDLNGNNENSKYEITNYIIADNVRNNIKFNCIVPLFDIVDINYQTNHTNIDLINDTSIQNTNIKNNNICNIPLGIWFADDTITLHRSVNELFPVWSLVISSQFKALPYFKGIQSSNGSLSQVDISTDLYNNAFATFAQVLSRQNTLMNTFNQLLGQFSNMQTQLNKLSAEVQNIATLGNIDVLQRQIINNKEELKEEMNTFKTYIEDSILGNLKWKVSV